MGTLTSLINVATSALLADQAALNVTSNNVANQNTTGYVRQVATFTSGDYITLNGTQEAASGPNVTVSSERDLALERQIQTLTQSVSSSTSEGTVLSQIESIFGVASSGSSAGSTQIGVAMDALFSSFTALASNPADSATRQGVIAAAKTLASAFNSAAQQFSELTTSLNQQVTSTVASVNALTQTIATLNGQIEALSPNSDAGTLEDQRQTAITQLSQYIGLNQTTTSNNGIVLTTTGGTTLVVDKQSFDLQESNAGTGAAQILDSYGNNVTSGVTGGSLGGLLAGVNTDVPSALNQLNLLATQVGNEVNETNGQGVNLDGDPGGAIFTFLNAGNGDAAADISATYVSLIAAAAAGEGTSGNTNADALAALATGTNASAAGTGIDGQTFDGFYAALLAQVGTSASSLNSNASAQQTALTQLTTQRDSYSGVSLDEEAANLTQYQRSYEAAAKVFTIADSLYTSALNLGVESAVS